VSEDENPVYFMTWNTYGTWLPGDARGWRKRDVGPQESRPLLEAWCRERLTDAPVLLGPPDRKTVENACREHCEFRGWHLFAVNARSNHVHLVVSANVGPVKVRDQLKANCTRRLRTQTNPLVRDKTWAVGGDTEVLNGESSIETAVTYVLDAQD
jgi:REP element-mobilizing transposase RayT